MASGDLATADALLADLTADHPADPLLDEARYERARLALRRHDPTAALAHLDALLASRPTSPLAAAAAFLACRIAVTAATADAGARVGAFLDRYPSSPHRREALDLMARLQHRAGGCAAAAPWIASLGRTAPGWSETAAWRRACPEAGR